jgi:hypothetical protein
LKCTIRFTLRVSAAFQYYQQLLAKELRITSLFRNECNWIGRIEDVKLVSDGIEITALGNWSAIFDVLYTALWSKTTTNEWLQTLETDFNNRKAKMYSMDNQGRLFIALTKNTTYANGADAGEWYYIIPNNSSRQIVGFQASIEINIPTNWRINVVSWNVGFTGATVVYNGIGNGAQQNLAVHLLPTACDIISVAIYNQTGANYGPNATENGATYAKVTDLRITTSLTNRVNTTLTANRNAGASVTATVASTTGMYAGMQLVMNSGIANNSEVITVTSVSSSTQFVSTFTYNYLNGQTVQGLKITADEVVQDVVSAANALNSQYIASGTSLIQSPGFDVTDLVFIDQQGGAVINALLKRGDTSTPQQFYEAGVLERSVYFRPVGYIGVTYYVDITDINVLLSLAELANKFYATYRDTKNLRLATANNSDTFSITTYGMTRQRSIDDDTTNSTQATSLRDVALGDQKIVRPEASIDFDRVFFLNGSEAPLEAIRPGDIFVLRNLPPIVPRVGVVDRIRSFRLSETILNLATYHIGVTPEEFLPRLDVMLAIGGAK